MEVEALVLGFPVQEAADAQGTLLAVEKLKCSVLNAYPVHDVDGAALHDAVDDCVLLLLLVDKFTLEGRADVEFAVIAPYAFVVGIDVAVEEFSDGDVMKLYIHR